MPHQYIYLSLAIYLLAWWTWLVSRSPGKRRLVLISLVGLVAGPVAELFYFHDYWHPPTVLGRGVISIEDFAAGFALAGIPAALFDNFFHTRGMPGAPPRIGWFLGMFAVASIAQTVLTFATPVNSMIACQILFVAAAAAMLTMRPDLLLVSLVSGMGMLLIAWPIYLFLFDVMAPNYWREYGLFDGTVLEYTAFSNVPIAELSWYFTWGSLAGMAHPFARGHIKTREEPRNA